MVRAKKIFGQHFLRDKGVILQIVENFPPADGTPVLEVGPGMGILTEELLKKFKENLYAVEVDSVMYEYLQKRFPQLGDHLIHSDFLKLRLDEIFSGPFFLVGNFPYNISSQIVFKMLDHRQQVRSMLGMFQKEVARRIVSGPGSKEYGIISVLVSAYYKSEYLFEVPEHAFEPPPKVKSAVIRLTRNDVEKLPCDEKLFKQIVKTSFNQRRKMLRNTLRSIIKPGEEANPIFTKRPEQLSLDEFMHITNDLVNLKST